MTRTHEIDGYRIQYNARRRAYAVTGRGIVGTDYYPAELFDVDGIIYALRAERDSDDMAQAEAEQFGGAL